MKRITAALAFIMMLSEQNAVGQSEINASSQSKNDPLQQCTASYKICKNSSERLDQFKVIDPNNLEHANACHETIKNCQQAESDCGPVAKTTKSQEVTSLLSSSSGHKTHAKNKCRALLPLKSE